jgi:glutamyl-tRNA synthetase
MAETVRVRIAPSPTGDPHVGTAYVGLINYAYARQNKGQFLLRIEDTDRERSTRESELAIYDALNWVGLEWDEGPDRGGPFGPYRQSERADIYREHSALLVRSGAAYPCFCPTDELDKIRLRQRALKRQTGYDGTCRAIPKDEAMARMAAGEPHVIRLRVPEGRTTVIDRLRGDVEIENEQIDDQVLLKTDGFPTYHLANVVDDHLMGITDVIRAEEWISSTPKHLMLYKAFGWQPPRFAHLPLLRNKDKSKISKRKNPVSLLYYRQIGVMPETMRNFLALLGHSMSDEREIFELDEFVNEFDFRRVSLGGPVFDIEKLLWLNGMRIRAMAPEVLAERVRDHLYSLDRLTELVPMAQERMRTLGDFADVTSFYMVPMLKLPIDELVAAGKGRAPKDSSALLLAAIEALDGIKTFDKESLEAALRDHCEQAGIPVGDLFMLFRIALTGRKATPPLIESMVILGRAQTTQRLRAASEALKAAPVPPVVK